jgi:hypothetical protein
MGNLNVAAYLAGIIAGEALCVASLCVCFSVASSLAYEMPHVFCDFAGLLAAVSGILESAAFPSTVTAITSAPDEAGKEGTVFLIKFSAEVMEREARLG